MRYVVFSEDGKLFSFSASEQTALRLGAVAERWTLVCLNRPLRSLEFLHTLWAPGVEDAESAQDAKDALASCAVENLEKSQET